MSIQYDTINLPPMEWDKIDRSDYDIELFRKPWLLYESFLQHRGYTLAHPESEKYCEIFKDTSHIPIKSPRDPFFPRPDEAFRFINPRVCPIVEPKWSGRLIYQNPTVHPALDARGRRVILKAMRPTSSEYAVLKMLSTNPLRADRRNHTIPVLEIMELGEWAITVTPEWGFAHWYPCVTAAEYLEFARELFEGLVFMHGNKICHGDIHKMNVVMNYDQRRDDVGGIYPIPRDFGPCGAKYAFIDFGSSQTVPAGKEMQLPEEFRGHHETEAPEIDGEEPVNVFSSDVYSLGALLRDHVKDTESCFAHEPDLFFSITAAAPAYIQFIDAVTDKTPHQRPTAAEALAWIERLICEAK